LKFVKGNENQSFTASRRFRPNQNNLPRFVEASFFNNKNTFDFI
jgi:hypothetical protein